MQQDSKRISIHSISTRAIAGAMVAVAVLLADSMTLAQDSPAQDSPDSVLASRVVRREVSAGHRVVGSVVPVRKSTVGSAIEGRVLEFLVDQGDAVEQGQPLAQLRTKTLEIELAGAKAELELYEQQFAEKSSGSRPEEKAEAKARMLAAEASMKHAADSLKRLETLVATNAINEQDIDDARERAESTRQAYLSAEAAWKLVEAGPRTEQIAQAKAQVDLQQQQVRAIEDRIQKLTIVAPFDGFVTEEHTEVGQWISQGDPVATIVELDEVEIQANVPAEQAVRLQRGNSVRIEFPELPEEIFTGVVDEVVPTAEVSTRTFPVNIRVENRLEQGRPVLLAGMLARATLPTGTKTSLPLVPKDALVLNSSQQAVLVIDRENDSQSRGTVRLVPVRLGVAVDGLIQIDAPVNENDLVVVVGNERLEDGQQVEIRQIQPADST